MSYCRWSNDDFQCDVYCYEDVSGGYTTHVAGARYIFKEPLPDPVEMQDLEGYIQRHGKVMQMCAEADKRPIGLSRDGQSFNVETPSEAADLLEDLQREGYNVPDHAIRQLREEAEDAALSVDRSGNGSRKE